MDVESDGSVNSLQNPFHDTRFEYEGRPLIWRGPTSLRLWQSPRNVYVRGSRGSGKTCLLQSVDIAQLLSNTMLAGQYAGEDVRTVGIYYRFPITLPPLLKKLETACLDQGLFNGERLFQLTFARTLYLAFWSAVVHRLTTINQIDGRTISGKREAEIVDRCVALAAKHGLPLDVPNLSGLRELSNALDIYWERQLDAVSEFDQEVLRLSIRNFNDPPKCFIEVATALLEILPEFKIKMSSDARVLIMLDEFDKLTRSQQVYVNSIVRDTKFPLFWCPAYVSIGSETTDTTLSNINLSLADRDIIDLDDPDEAHFSDLCAKVSSIRLYYRAAELDRLNGGKRLISPSDQPENYFNLTTRLGTPTLNTLFAHKLKGSFRDEVLSQVYEIATRLAARGADLPTLSDSGFEVKNDELPLLQAYLVVLGVVKEQEFAIRGKSEQSFNAGLRRKLRGASLVAARKFKWKPMPWAGEKIAIALADGCIRDFLDVMAAIYSTYIENEKQGALQGKVDRKEAGVIRRFSESPHPIRNDTQMKAFAKVSEGHAKALTSKTDSDGAAVSRIVHFLARLTGELQTNERLGALATPERGIFIIDFRSQDITAEYSLSDIHVMKRIMMKAVEDGHLKLITRRKRMATVEVEESVAADVLRLRVHRRYAPYFSFSYLGALEEVTLRLKYIRDVIMLPGKETESLVRDAATDFARQGSNSLHTLGWQESAQYPLPFEGDDK